MSEQQESGERREKEITDRQLYNIVTDTVAGPNLRLKDNLIQGISILACLLLGAGVGVIFAENRLAGALIGGFVGLVLGLLGSGVFLMIYRAVGHVRGRHD